jgi:amylosucrase
VHRPHYPADRYEKRHDPATPEGAVFEGLRKLISARSGTPEFAGTRLVHFNTNNRSVLGYQRPGDGTHILVLANFSDGHQTITARTLSGFAAEALDILTGNPLGLGEGVMLRPQEFAWLRVAPAASTRIRHH